MRSAEVTGSDTAFFSSAVQLLQASKPFVIATVVQTRNSTPVPAGTRMIVEASGRQHGTVGGGAVEAEALRCAARALASGLPEAFSFDMQSSNVDAGEPVCGGYMKLLVQPVTQSSQPVFEAALKGTQSRKSGFWITRFSLHTQPQVGSRYSTRVRARPTTERFLFFPGPGEQSGKFICLVRPDPRLLLVGGGHVGQAVAAQATILGFNLVVLEDRPEFARPELFPPGAEVHLGDVQELLQKLRPDPDTYIVIVTRGHQQDMHALRGCIHSPAAYIGMMGSRRKVPLVRRAFLDQGLATVEEFNRVHAPIGIDIGAETVPEIATSIVAQLVAVRRTGRSSRALVAARI